MLRGFYTATNGMLAQQKRMEVLSNNMTNAMTPGYKADQASLRAFPELLIQRMENQELPVTSQRRVGTTTPIGSINTGVYVQEAIPNFVQTSLRETGVSTDFALVQGETPDENGMIFFMVENEEGQPRYMRNGNFTVDGAGFLTTNHGHYVLDAAGNRIQTNGLEFQLTPEGLIQYPGGQAALNLAYIADPNQLIKNGNDLFELEEGAAAPADARTVAGLQYNVQQGYLENSNVDPGQTMTEMMSAYRTFEMNQKVLQAYDRNMDKAVNDIAKLG